MSYEIQDSLPEKVHSSIISEHECRGSESDISLRPNYKQK